MNSSMRLPRRAGWGSRGRSTWRSGRTSRWVAGLGMMSRSRRSRRPTRRRRPRGRGDRRGTPPSCGEHPLVGHRRATDANELADRDGGIEEPWRIVVAVASPGAVDEHRILASDLRPPARETGPVRGGTQRAPRSFSSRRHPVVRGGDGARARRVREDVDLGQARLAPCAACSRMPARPPPGSRRSRRSSG